MRKFSGIQITIGIGVALVAVLGLLFYAALTPDLPRAALEAKYGTPPSQFLTLPDGSRVHYRVRGPDGAPTIILLHGFMGSLFAWERWSAALSDRFRVVSVDLPGHGLTGAIPSGGYSQGAMAEFVKAFADKLGLKRFAIAGNSMGGDVAAHFAELYPDRVSALVLVDAAGAQTDTRPRRNLIGFAASLPFAESLAADLPPCWLFPVGKRKAWNDCGDNPMAAFARLPGVRAAMLAHYRLPLDGYVWAHVKDITAPTLILWGQDDHTIPITSAFAWHKAIAGSKLITYPHAGHLAMLDVPEQSAKDTGEFLEGAAVGVDARAANPDSCMRQLPASLVAAIPVAFPGYRAPYESDNDAEDIKANKANGGSGCLGVAQGDFAGSHTSQYLLALTSANDRSGRVVIANSSRKGWTFRQLEKWDGRNRLYVDRVGPGKYDISKALDGPVGADERESMICRHDGAVAGEADVTGIVYCQVDGRWYHVQVSD